MADPPEEGVKEGTVASLENVEQDEEQRADWSSNWVILQNIFAHLSHSDLGKVAQVNTVWKREVELRRRVYGVDFEFEVRGRGKNAVTNSTRLFDILDKCEHVRFLRLDRLRFPWPAGLVGAERSLNLQRLLPRGLPYLVRMCISKCALHHGFDHLLDAISSVAPNLEDVNVESSSISLAEARALVSVIRAPGLRRLSVGEFADVDTLSNLITTLAEREMASQSTETTTTATTTTATATTETTTSAAGSAESGVNAGHEGDVESEGESHEDSVGRRGTGLQPRETDRRLEHLAILADMSLTEGIVDNLAALRHLRSLALCGYYMSGGDFAPLVETLGATLQVLVTWLPFVEQNVLCGFSALKRLRLVLMVREEDGWTEATATAATFAAVTNATTYAAAAAATSANDAITYSQSDSALANRRTEVVFPTKVLVPSLPMDDHRLDAWQRLPLQRLEVFVEIDRPRVMQRGDALDVNPILTSVSQRFGPKGLSSLHVDVGPGPLLPLTTGVRQIVQNSDRLEEVIIYGGHQRHPEIDISAFEEPPQSLRTLNLFGIQLKDDFLIIPTERAHECVKNKIGDATKVEVLPTKWRPGFEPWHQQSWRLM